MVEACTYDDFLDVGRRLDAIADLYWSEGPPNFALIEDYLARNVEPLAAARFALTGNCSVPLEYTPTWLSSRSHSFEAINKFGQALSLEGQLAEHRGEISRALRIGIEMVQAGVNLRRGGLIFDKSSADMLALRGVVGLRNIRRQVSTEDAAHLIAQLFDAEARREPYWDIVARDRHWQNTSGHVDPPFDLDAFELFPNAKQESDVAANEAIRGFLRFQLELPEFERRKQDEDLDNRVLAHFRMLAIDAALRIWRRARGQFPMSLNELTPEFLSELPADPFTHSDFCYRPADDDFLLYSPGPTGVNHGGQPGCWATVACGQADLTLDEFDDWPIVTGTEP